MTVRRITALVLAFGLLAGGSGCQQTVKRCDFNGCHKVHRYDF